MAVIWTKNIKQLTGVVVSNTMQSTLVVKVSSVKMHSLYKKRFLVTKKYYAHVLDSSSYSVGQNVTLFLASKPISKTKRRLAK